MVAVDTGQTYDIHQGIKEKNIRNDHGKYEQSFNRWDFVN
jgi:hypothetical protein